jgi:hypothetical protein
VPIIMQRADELSTRELLSSAMMTWKQTYSDRYQRQIDEYAEKAYRYMVRMRFVHRWAGWAGERQAIRQAILTKLQDKQRRKWYVLWVRNLNLHRHRLRAIEIAHEYDQTRMKRHTHSIWMRAVQTKLKDKIIAKLERKWWNGQARILMQHVSTADGRRMAYGTRTRAYLTRINSLSTSYRIILFAASCACTSRSG